MKGRKHESCGSGPVHIHYEIYPHKFLNQKNTTHTSTWDILLVCYWTHANSKYEQQIVWKWSLWQRLLNSQWHLSTGPQASQTPTPTHETKQLMNRIQLKGMKRVDLVEACRQSLAVSVAQEDTPFLPITSNQHNGTLWLISRSVNSLINKKSIKAKCNSAENLAPNHLQFMEIEEFFTCCFLCVPLIKSFFTRQFEYFL